MSLLQSYLSVKNKFNWAHEEIGQTGRIARTTFLSFYDLFFSIGLDFDLSLYDTIFGFSKKAKIKQSLTTRVLFWKKKLKIIFRKKGQFQKYFPIGKYFSLEKIRKMCFFPPFWCAFLISLFCFALIMLLITFCINWNLETYAIN